MFTEKEQNLANEAALTASLLANGLNALRKASLYNKGLYYQAFFSLSIGMERLLKMIVIQQYRVEQEGDFPTDMNLRQLGHDLIKLFARTGIVLDGHPLHPKIVAFLNDFAKKSRYYNIDSMLNNNVQYEDPLAAWYLLSQDILDTVPKRKTISHKQEFAAMLDAVSIVRYYNLQGEMITDSMGLLEEWETREAIQSYSVQYVFEIITKLVSEVRRLERKKYLMPVLSEFFSLYHPYWKPYEIRQKKNWLHS